MLALELLWGPAPRLTREPWEADGHSAWRDARIRDPHVRIDRVSVGLESEHQADLEAVGFSRQRELGGLVRQNQRVLVKAHRDDFAGAVAVGRQLQAGGPEVAKDDHRLLAAIAEH